MRISLLGMCALTICANLAWASDATQISYSTTALGGDRWQCEYSVKNLSLGSAIKEFTIYFDEDLSANLAVGASTPSGWDAIVWQPEPFLNDPGAYDALDSGAGILPGNIVGSFSVTFDWLGAGAPGSQFYEVVDPVTFATLDSGWTIPEPATLLLLGLGSLILASKRKTEERR